MNFRYFKSTKLVILICALTLIFGYLSNIFENWINSFTTSKTICLVKSIIDLTGIISTTGLLTITFAYINYCGWKFKYLKWLIDIPNLNGRYTGKLESSFLDSTGEKKIMDCILEINQTASSIHIRTFYGDKVVMEQSSGSKSVIGEIIKDEDDFFSLIFTYENKPNALNNELHSHYGTTVLRYFPDNKTFEGDYYNDRNNKGNIKAKFTQKNRIGRFI